MSRDTPIRSSIARESLFSSRTSLEKIWVWFCAIRFVMCRQPQQKSGSKQPWSNWYDRHTVVAISLIGAGRGKGSSQVRAGEIPSTTWWRVRARETPKSHCKQRRSRELLQLEQQGIFLFLNSKCAGKGNMASPQQHSSELETKTTVVLLMSVEKFCIFNFFQQYWNNYMSQGLPSGWDTDCSRWRDQCFKLKTSVAFILDARFLFQRTIWDQATEGVALTTTMALTDLQTLWTQRLCNAMQWSVRQKHPSTLQKNQLLNQT